MTFPYGPTNRPQHLAKLYPGTQDSLAPPRVATGVPHCCSYQHGSEQGDLRVVGESRFVVTMFLIPKQLPISNTGTTDDEAKNY